jgi:KaiC/GvpD/RAD55 family RecA-like ATPase
MRNTQPDPEDARRFLAADPRGTLILLARCARALNLAHFDSVPDKPGGFQGARRCHLARRLDEEGVDPPSWEMAKGLLAALSKGPRLLESEDAVEIAGIRMPGNKWRFSRPEVFPVLDYLLADSIPRPLLLDWYRAHLCARYAMDDSPTFTSFALEWVDAFNRIESESVAREDLLALNQACFPHAPTDWSAGLIEALTFLSILSFRMGAKHLSRYRIQKIDAAFLLANLLGRSTGISGLDYLFFGGLGLVPLKAGQAGQSLVISGPPGVGKSTLGLSLATQTAARGGLALYLRFELGQATVLGQIAQYHRKLMPFVRIQSQEGKQLEVPAAWPIVTDASRRGLLVISDVATEPLREMQRGVVAELEKQREHSGPERLVVFDSVSASRNLRTGQGDWRTFLRQTTAKLQALGYAVVYLVESDHGDGQEVEEFMADVNVRLHTRSEADYPHSFRVLEITKSRRQTSHRGEHVFSITSGVGMQVFPSSSAVLNARRRRESHLRYGEKPALIDPGIPGFATCLGTARPGQKEGEVSWWRRGSVTALIGPRGTLKSSFAEAFCMKVDQASLGEASALSLHFADEFSVDRFGELRRAHRRPIVTGIRFDIPFHGHKRATLDKGAPSSSRDATLSYVLFRSGYLAPGHVLQAVADLIAEKRKQGLPIRRAAIADAGNIVPDFPALKADPVFLSALCDLLSTERITTVLLYSLPEHGAEDYVIDQVRSASENILSFSPVRYAGRELTALSVERSDNGTHSRGSYELRQGRDGALEVAPTFDLVLDIHTNKPTSAVVNLLLHAETKLQRGHHDSLKRHYREVGAYEAQVLEHATGFVRHGVSREVMVAKRALWIMQVDGYRVATLTRQAKTGPGLCDLAGLHTGLGPLCEAMGQSSAGPTFSLPYYLNPSFLVARKEFLAFLQREEVPAHRRIVQGKGDYTWGEVLDAAEALLGSDEKWKDHIPFDCPLGPGERIVSFDCPLEPGENLNCLFLEILASLAGGADKVNCDFRTCFGTSSPFLTSGRNLLVEAALLLRRLLRDSVGEHTGHRGALNRHRRSQEEGKGEKGRERAIGGKKGRAGTVRPFVTSRAIFWRHWYSTFRQLASDISSNDIRVNPGLTLLQLPGGVWMSGDWHLGVLEESVGVRAGAAILIEELCSRSSALNRMIQGVGLTPFRSFYASSESERAFPVAEVPATWFAPYVNGQNVIRRSSLGSYQEVQSILEAYLGAIIGLEVEEEKLARAVWDRFLGMDQILTDLFQS